MIQIQFYGTVGAQRPAQKGGVIPPLVDALP